MSDKGQCQVTYGLCLSVPDFAHEVSSACSAVATPCRHVMDVSNDSHTFHTRHLHIIMRSDVRERTGRDIRTLHHAPRSLSQHSHDTSHFLAYTSRLLALLAMGFAIERRSEDKL